MFFVDEPFLIGKNCSHDQCQDGGREQLSTRSYRVLFGTVYAHINICIVGSWRLTDTEIGRQKYTDTDTVRQSCALSEIVLNSWLAISKIISNQIIFTIYIQKWVNI